MPQFSIILPTYNREDFILTAINSVVAQTYNDWELIIIDDGSTDSTKDFIAPYTKDLRIRYYFQKNQERSAARNNGIDLAKGKFICFLDSDDYYLSNHLSILNDEIEKLHNPQNIIFTVNRFLERPDGQRSIQPSPKSIVSFNEQLIHYAILSNPPIQTMCIRHTCLKEIRFKDEWLPYSECYQFSFDLLKKGMRYHFIDTPTVVMVIHETNTTRLSFEFLYQRYNFINKFSALIGVTSNPDIKAKKTELLLGIATFENQRQKRLKTAVEILKLNPKALGSRPFWGLIKRIIFS